ncbi:MAG: hypothetical protein K0R72_435 [Clostridia bacterium]|jgi:uncharacterized protein YoxC|nr:hypothetical protein [Clostridia bacterium]
MDPIISSVLIGICVFLIFIIIEILIVTWVIGMGIDSSKNITEIGNILIETRELLRKNNEQIYDIKEKLDNITNLK